MQTDTQFDHFKDDANPNPKEATQICFGVNRAAQFHLIQ